MRCLTLICLTCEMWRFYGIYIYNKKYNCIVLYGAHVYYAYCLISVRVKTRFLELGWGGVGNNVRVTTLFMLRC